MRAQSSEKAFHEPENARLDSEGLTRFRFMVPMHAEKNRKGALHEPQPKKREQGPRTPNVSRWNAARAFREAFGLRPACRRFRFKGSKRDRIRGSLSPRGRR